MVPQAAVNLIGSYNYALVALSVLIAMFASYAALEGGSRVTAAGGWGRAGLVVGRGLRDGNRHLVHALHRNAGVRPAGSRRLPLADRSAVTVCGHSRFGHCAVRGEPTENECVPSVRRKCPDGWGYCEHALHRHGCHALAGHNPL